MMITFLVVWLAVSPPAALFAGAMIRHGHDIDGTSR